MNMCFGCDLKILRVMKSLDPILRTTAMELFLIFLLDSTVKNEREREREREWMNCKTAKI